MELSKKENQLLDEIVSALAITDKKELIKERLRIIQQLMKLSAGRAIHILLLAFAKFDRSIKQSTEGTE